MPRFVYYFNEGVSKRCILFFYKQNPDFHKPGLCHVQKNLYLYSLESTYKKCLREE